jgi:CHASE1-domain containing sensor protein
MIRGNKNVYITLTGTILVLIISTFLAWWLARQVVIRKINDVFFEQVTTIESWVGNRLELYKTVVLGIQGYWAGSENVTADKWNSYVKSLKIDSRFPNIVSISYAKHVNNQYVIAYIYPTDRSDALGFDLTSEERRLSAINKAIDEDAVGITDRVLLAADQSPGFVMVAPLYPTPDVPEDLEERRLAVDGVAVIAFKSKDVFKDIFEITDPFPSLDFELYKGKVLEDNHILYDHDSTYYIRKGEDLRRLETKRTFFIDGEVLTLLVASKPSFQLSKAERNLPTFILIGGLIISALMFTIFYLKIISLQSINFKNPQKLGTVRGKKP